MSYTHHAWVSEEDRNGGKNGLNIDGLLRRRGSRLHIQVVFDKCEMGNDEECKTPLRVRKQ